MLIGIQINLRKHQNERLMTQRALEKERKKNKRITLDMSQFALDFFINMHILISLS